MKGWCTNCDAQDVEVEEHVETSGTDRGEKHTICGPCYHTGWSQTSSVVPIMERNGQIARMVRLARFLGQTKHVD